MEVFRLSRRKFGDQLTGKGAAIAGARWNSPGTELVYTAGNRSLAMAEVAVHFTLANVPSDYMMMTVYIPDDLSIQKINVTDLPSGWNIFPHSSVTQKIGDRFAAEARHCLLQVPSAVTRGDFNILINPYHVDFPRIKVIEVVEFPFDRRIFR